MANYWFWPLFYFDFKSAWNLQFNGMQIDPIWRISTHFMSFHKKKTCPNDFFYFWMFFVMRVSHVRMSAINFFLLDWMFSCNWSCQTNFYLFLFYFIQLVSIPSESRDASVKYWTYFMHMFYYAKNLVLFWWFMAPLQTMPPKDSVSA